MDGQARKYRRLYKSFLWAFVIASSLLVWKTFEAATAYRRYEQVTQIHWAQTYAMDYALRSEQATAGEFEAKWLQCRGE